MRGIVRHIVLAFVLSCCFGGRASAQSEKPPTTKQDSLDATIHAGLIGPAGEGGLGGDLGLTVMYHVTPEIRAGGRFHLGGATKPFNLDNESGTSASMDHRGVGGRMEYHLRPTAIVDPWAGAGLGALYMKGSGRQELKETWRISGYYPDVSVHLGVDLILGKTVILGVEWSYVRPLVSGAEGNLYERGYVSSLIPALRVGFLFLRQPTQAL